MPDAKNYCVTELSADDVLILTLNELDYKVAQFTATFSMNEVPTCACLVAIGRDARSQDAAVISLLHDKAKTLTQMMKATITFHPKGEYRPDGKTKWPDKPQTIFDGYYTGMAYRKVQGKVYAMLNFVHWLVDLSFSSTLSGDSHPSTPMQLTSGAIVAPLRKAGVQAESAYAAPLIGHEIIHDKVETDLWLGIKDFLCALANENRMTVVCPDGFNCGGNGEAKKNDRALRALKRIEDSAAAGRTPEELGGSEEDEAEDCRCPTSDNHRPLKLETKGIKLVTDAVALAITQETLQSFSNITFWDTMIGGYFPMFSMAIAPLVDTAVVIADAPAFRLYWKVISPDEAEMIDSSGLIPRPLQYVAVYGDYEDFTKIGTNELSGKPQNGGPSDGQSPSDPFTTICVGGCWADDATDKQDGVALFIQAPAWLKGVTSAGVNSPASTGIGEDAPTPTATTPEEDPPEPPDKLPGETLRDTGELYTLYAKTVFVSNMLRGRTAMLGGKLRFDIAPGTIIKFISTPEVFLEGVDSLAETIVGSVYRVTISINSEAQLASTSYHLVSVRTESENTQDRTSVNAHPLFGDDIYFGAPLVKAYNL